MSKSTYMYMSTYSVPLHTALSACLYLQESFPEYPELLCEAVSLGRRLQDPLIEFTALANAENDELLALPMDTLQSALDPDELRACMEIELVTRVNDVGVDVNFCLEHPHAVSMLPYVCGLGPRKAMSLLKVCVHHVLNIHIHVLYHVQCTCTCMHACI